MTLFLTALDAFGGVTENVFRLETFEKVLCP